jgi:hypothetical protein
MAYLALVCLHGGDLPIKGISDVDPVIDLRAVHQPDLAHRPRGEPLGLQGGMGELVAGIRVDRVQRQIAGSAVVRVAAAKARPVPLGTPREDTLRAQLSNDPNKLTPLRCVHSDVAFSQPKEPHVRDSQHVGRCPLLGSSHTRNLLTWHRPVETARVAIGQHDVGDSHTRVGPTGDGPTGPKLPVIWMSDDREGSLDIAFGQDRQIRHWVHHLTEIRWKATMTYTDSAAEARADAGDPDA